MRNLNGACARGAVSFWRNANGVLACSRSLGGGVAHLLRLIVVALLVLASQAWAQGQCTEYIVTGQGFSTIHKTQAAACSAVTVSHFAAHTGWPLDRISGYSIAFEGGQCKATATGRNGDDTTRPVVAVFYVDSRTVTCAPPPSCDPPKKIKAETGGCQEPWEQVKDFCAGRKDAAYVDQEVLTGPPGAGGSLPQPPAEVCHQVAGMLTWPPDWAAYGCSARFERSFSAASHDGARTHHWGSATMDGSACTWLDVPNPIESIDKITDRSDGKGKCPNGSPGTVNGVTVCIPFGNTTDGVSETKWTDTTTNADGTKETKEVKRVTQCNATSCTTTTTTTTNGTTTISSTTTSRSETCSKDKTNKACTENGAGGGGSGDGDGGGFSGSCQGGFKCTGDDAVACAIALEQHKRACQFFNTELEPGSVVARALAGNDDKSADALKATAAQQAVAAGQFDYAGKGWARSCPADPVFPLGFTQGSFSIPFSRLCGGPLELLAQAAVAITALGCLTWCIGGRT